MEVRCEGKWNACREQINHEGGEVAPGVNMGYNPLRATGKQERVGGPVGRAGHSMVAKAVHSALAIVQCGRKRTGA